MAAPLDWNAIRSDYESGKFSQSALERKYTVSRRAIYKRAAKEQWTPSERPQVPGPRSQVPESNIQGVINRDVNAAVRVIDAIKYRQQGWTYDRIASQCGYANPGVARVAVQRELDRVITQNVEDWRNDHISRLEKMHEEIWKLAMDEKSKSRLFAFDRLTTIEERQAKLLGLDVRIEETPGPQIIFEEVPAGYLEGPSV